MDSQKIQWLNNEFSMIDKENIANSYINPTAMIFAFLHSHSRVSPYLVIILEKLIDYSYFIYFLIIAGFLIPKKIHNETSFALGLSFIWLILIAVFAVEIYSGQILRFASIICALFIIGIYAGINIAEYIFQNTPSRILIFYTEIAYLTSIAVWLALFSFNLINIPILLILVLLASILSGLEWSYLNKNWHLNNFNLNKKVQIYISLAAGGWISALAGGGFLILAMGIQKSLLFILFAKFLSLCRWANIKNKVDL
jgi:hypothetical protein